MYVQFKDKEALKGYFAIRPEALYVVLAIDISLGEASSEARVLLIEDYPGKLGLPKFIPLSMLRLVDDTPQEWESVIFHGDTVNTPVLVHGFREILSSDFYIRLHDLEVTDEDMVVVANYYDRYGGNILLPDTHNIQGSDEYIACESKLTIQCETLAYRINGGAMDAADFKRYVDNLVMFTDMQLRAIEVARTVRQREMLADTLARVMAYIGYRDRVEVMVPSELLEVYNDVNNRTVLIENAVERFYRIQHRTVLNS